MSLPSRIQFLELAAGLEVLGLAVENVSQDVITPDNPNEMPYYLAKIDVDPEDISEDIRERITAGMRMRIGDKKEAARAHREANPNQDYSRPNRRKFDRDA